MHKKLLSPQEGDLHAVVEIEGYVFELRYGYNEEHEREGAPFVLYPDLNTKPIFTKDGYRIVSAIQSVCDNYENPESEIAEDCCYTCSFYSDPKADVGICQCERMRHSVL